MADIRTLDRELQPYARALVDIARSYGWNPRVTSARRGPYEQGRLHRAYLRGNLRGYAAPPGASLHGLGLAFDLVVDSPFAQAELGRLWSRGFSASAPFRFRWFPHDPIHFEAVYKTSREALR